MKTPSVYINHEASTVVVVKTTPSTVYCVQIKDSLVRDLQSYRIMDFHKEFKAIDYCPFIAAQKMLLGAIPCTSSGTKELKGVLTMSTSSIIVVSRTAEFVGRFVDASTAAKVSAETDIIITSASDLESFTKPLLNGNLSQQHTETALKNITKPQLAEQLFSEYLTKEITVAKKEKKEKVVKEKKESVSAFSQIKARLEGGEVLVADELVTEYNTTRPTIASIISNMRSEKYMKNNLTVPVLTGRVDGKTVFFLEEFKPTNLDEKKTAERKAKGESKPGLKSIVRALLVEGPKTMDELIEATGSIKKLISDCLAYLKNPKYAGSEGPLTINRDKETGAYSIA